MLNRMLMLSIFSKNIAGGQNSASRKNGVGNILGVFAGVESFSEKQWIIINEKSAVLSSVYDLYPALVLARSNRALRSR